MAAKDLYHSLDLNLLRTFLVLSQELNMRKASQRLFVSQPAISQSLQKLRRHFNDELFVKVAKGLEPTPFADELTHKLTPLFDDLAGALNELEAFDPSTLERTLRIAVAPIVLTCLSGTLFPLLKTQAPNCTIELVGWSKETLSEIQKGEVLMGVNLETDIPQSIYTQRLVELTGKIVLRSGHPLTKASLNPEDLEPYPIASIITPGWNDNHVPAADIMRAMGLTPTVGFRSEFVMAVVDVLQHSDFFMPHSDLFPIHQFPFLKMANINLDGKPYFHHVESYYHSKYRHSPLIHWLFSQVQDALNAQLQFNNKQGLSAKYE